MMLESEQAKPKRTKKRRWVTIAITAALLAAAIAWWLRPLDPIEPKIGNETTYLTEPMRDDGTIDYLAALNNRLSEGVTPQNNAFVDIAKVLPRDVWQSDAHRRFVYDRLDVEPPDENAPRFVSYHEFAERYAVDFAVEDTPSKHAFLDQLNAAIDEQNGPSPQALDAWLGDNTPAGRHASTRPARRGRLPGARTQPRYDQDMLPEGPWRAVDRPLVYAWLKRNEPMLERAVTGARKSECFAPLWAGGSGRLLAAATSVGVSDLRSVARALSMRVYRKLRRGRFQRALADVEAIMRWGGHTAERPSLLCYLIGSSLRALGNALVRDLAAVDGLSPQQVRTLQRRYRSIPVLRSPAETIDRAERFVGLSYVTAFLRRLDKQGFATLESRDDEDDNFPVMVDREMLDPNVVLRTTNNHYDRLVQLKEAKTFGDFKKRKRALSQSVKQRIQANQTWLAKARRLLSLPTTRRELISKHISALMPRLIAPNGASMRSHWNLRMQRQLTRIAISLAGYRAEQGAYPKKLSALSPKWLEKVPNDLFTRKPLHYERRSADEAIVYSVGSDQKDNGGDDVDDLVAHLKPIEAPATQPDG
jgi:hypothetical protein